MIKEMFALYLTFASPVGNVELFVRELPNCDNASVIAEQEYAIRNIDRSKLSQSGYMCIGWEYHMLRQKFLEGVPLDPKYKPVQRKQCTVPMEIK